MAKTKRDLSNLKAYRMKLGLNQQAFWSGLGVTQSGGSRYESGQNVPQPMALLLTLRETGKIKQSDINAAAAFIKKTKARK